MALDVSALKEQIAKEKESLKNVDENIRKITGRDPNEPRRRTVDSRDNERDSEPPRKRSNVFSRLGAATAGRRIGRTRAEEKEDEDDDEEDIGTKPAVQSSVVSTAKKITRDELINAQNAGEKGKARNRRMFGMLLGTLASFNADGQGRQSKQALKQKEVETRLEEETEQERKKLASERKTLFTERKLQQRRIGLMEEKIALANELEEWEKEWEKKSRFIMTKASPSIFFLPIDFTPRTQRALQDSKDRIKGLVEKHKTSVAETMQAYDDEIKFLENKQDNDDGKRVRNGEGASNIRSFRKGGKIENEPEDEMDLDSMEHHVDIKVDVDDAETNPDNSNVSEKNDLTDQLKSEMQNEAVTKESDSAPNADNTMDHDVSMDGAVITDDVNPDKSGNMSNVNNVRSLGTDADINGNGVASVLTNKQSEFVEEQEVIMADIRPTDKGNVEIEQDVDRDVSENIKEDTEAKDSSSDSESNSSSGSEGDDTISKNKRGEPEKLEISPQKPSDSERDRVGSEKDLQEAPVVKETIQSQEVLDVPENETKQHSEAAKEEAAEVTETRGSKETPINQASKEQEPKKVIVSSKPVEKSENQLAKKIPATSRRDSGSSKNSGNQRRRRSSSNDSDSSSESSSSSSDEKSKKSTRRHSAGRRSREKSSRHSYRSRHRRDRSRSRSRDRHSHHRDRRRR